MPKSRLVLSLTLLNVVLLVALVAQTLGTARADGQPSVLRARGLEIVDEQGRVRASIAILPAERSQDGAPVQAETVLLRLITEQGRPSVKIGASERSSGLSFAGPTGTKDTYVTLGSDARTSTLRLRNEEGREQVVRP